MDSFRGKLIPNGGGCDMGDSEEIQKICLLRVCLCFY